MLSGAIIFILSVALENTIYKDDIHSIPNSDHSVIASQFENGLPKSGRYPPGFGYSIYLRIQIEKLTNIPYKLLTYLMNAMLYLFVGFWIIKINTLLKFNIKIGYICTFLFGIYPPLFSSSILDSEIILFMSVFLFGILTYLKFIINGNWYYLFYSGIFIGISLLIRPTPLFLYFFLIGTLTILNSTKLKEKFHYFLKYTVIAYLGVSSVCLPWSVYISCETGKSVLGSTGFLPSHIDGLKRFPDNKAGKLYLQIIKEQKSGIKILATHQKVFIQEPISFVLLWINKVGRVIYGIDSNRCSIEYILAFLNIPMMIYGFLGLMKYKGKLFASLLQKQLIMVLIIVFLYFWLTSIVVVPLVRYMVPVFWIPLLFSLMYFFKPGKRIIEN